LRRAHSATSCDFLSTVAAPGGHGLRFQPNIGAIPFPRCPCRRRPHPPPPSRTKAGRPRVADHHAASEWAQRRSTSARWTTPRSSAERQVARAAGCSICAADAGGCVWSCSWQLGVAVPACGVARAMHGYADGDAGLPCAGRHASVAPACVRSSSCGARGAVAARRHGVGLGADGCAGWSLLLPLAMTDATAWRCSPLHWPAWRSRRWCGVAGSARAQRAAAGCQRAAAELQVAHRPHFLFNALNTACAGADRPRARRERARRLASCFASRWPRWARR